MGPKGIWDTHYLAIFLVATTEERGAAVWMAEARLLQPGCQHLFPDPSLSVCGAGGQETPFSLLLLALGPCHHSAKLSALWIIWMDGLKVHPSSPPSSSGDSKAGRQGEGPLSQAVTKPAFRGTSSRDKLPHDFSTLSNQRDTVTTGATVKELRVGHMTAPTGRRHLSDEDTDFTEVAATWESKS